MKQYRTIQGDTWDLIAKKQYGDEKKLDILMMNNFSLLGYVVFPAGVLVDLPELPDEERPRVARIGGTDENAEDKNRYSV